MRQGLILIVFVALLPVVIASSIQGFSALNSTREMATGRLGAHASAIAERQRDPFIIAQHLLLALATNTEVTKISGGCDAALRASLSNYPPVTNLARTSADGVVRCSALPHKGQINLTNQGWWQRGIRAEGMTITKAPIFAPIAQREVLFLILPLRTPDGRQDGTLTAAIDINYLRNALVKAVDGKKGSVAIITRDEIVVAQGKQKLTFVPNLDARRDIAQLTRGRDGTEWMYTFHKLYSSELFVVYAEPRAQVMAAAVSQVRASLFLPLVSILLASLAIWIGTNRLALIWLRDLQKVAGRFAKGDFTGDRARFENAPEEIAALSADLHSMADVIHRRNADLTLALEAKSLLTREVHHRVKNNLQIINSLLTLQSGRVQEGAAKEVLAQTRARISALALIHRLLYEQDNGYDRGEVAIDNLMVELCTQLRGANRTSSNVELSCNASDFPVPVDYAVPLTLFVVEAVTNAFRHAFPAGSKGAVTLKFHLDGDNAVLDISDNGQGYVVNDKSGQMGTELMRGFATQVDGKLDISSGVGAGTRVILTFGLPQMPRSSGSAAITA
jgi:two-component sensor histidine kinase